MFSVKSLRETPSAVWMFRLLMILPFMVTFDGHRHKWFAFSAWLDPIDLGHLPFTIVALGVSWLRRPLARGIMASYIVLLMTTVAWHLWWLSAPDHEISEWLIVGGIIFVVPTVLALQFIFSKDVRCYYQNPTR
jgi:hypothetical protein